jgi:N-glycosylase/DNA lyase
VRRSPAGTALHRFRFTPPAPFDLAAVVRTHGWVELAPWRWDGATLARAERIGGAVGEIAIKQAAGARPGTGRVGVTWRVVDASGVNGSAVDGPTSGPSGRPLPTLPRKRGRDEEEEEEAELRAAVRAVVGRALSWDWDAAPFLKRARRLDRRCHDLVARGGGRLLRGTTFYEDFVKSVCTVNTTWAGTVRMAARLVERVGGGTFPTPGDVLACGAGTLQAACGLGYRAAPLVRATERLLADGAISADGHAVEQDGRADALGYDYLKALPGIGPYAAAHCRVLLHDFSVLPIDSAVTAHGKDVLGLKPKDIAAHYARWGDYRFLGYRLGKLVARLAAGEPPAW